MAVAVVGVVVAVAVGLPVVAATGMTLLALVAAVGSRVTGRSRGRRVRARSSRRRSPAAPEGPRWATQWDVAPPAGAVPLARRRLSAVLDGWGLNGEVRENVALVVTELLSNAVEHGGGPVRLTVEARDGDVRVEVHDAVAAPPRPHAPDRWEVRGRGLQVVEALSTDWGWTDEPDGKVVWANVPHPRSSPSDADHPDDR